MLNACLFLAAIQPQQTLPENIRQSISPLAIKVTVDGTLIKFPDTAPIMVGSRVLVPLRGVFEHMGAQLDWNSDAKTVTVHDATRTIVLPVGQSQADVDGKQLKLDQPAVIIEGRTLVPLRFIAASLGALVEWQTAERTVAISTTGTPAG